MTTAPQHLLSMATLLAALPLVASGCAVTARNALELEKSQLEREVARLQADKASLDARNSALDDRLLILERRLERCQEPERPSLPVVKLGASRLYEEDPPLVSEPPEDRHPTGGQSAGERPVLTLRGSTSYEVGSPASRRSVQGSRTEDFGHLGPDDLGVVSDPDIGQIAGGDNPMDEFNAAYQLYANQRYGEALDAFAAYLGKYPEHDYADNAMFWRGECYLASGRILKAVGELERLVARYPGSDKKASALYRVGFAYDKLGDEARALEYYFRVVDNHPGTDAARRAARRVAVLQEAGIFVGAAVPTSAGR